MQLVYFASPMCSWCWGFSPVIQRIKAKFAKQAELRLVLVPFRVDTVKIMDGGLRNYVLTQWHKVHDATGQAFDFAFSVGQDFVYDTKPACCAIKAVHQQQAALELDFMDIIQAAFYTRNLDVTNEAVLIELARNARVNVGLFVEHLHAEQTTALLDEDFAYCQQLGVRSYPTLIGIHQAGRSILTRGFQPYARMEQLVTEWLGR